jgi:hypothetical protein
MGLVYFEAISRYFHGITNENRDDSSLTVQSVSRPEFEPVDFRVKGRIVTALDQ